MFNKLNLSYVLFLAIFTFDVYATTLAITTADSLNVRDVPSGNVITTLPRGTIVSAIGITGQWVKISYLSNDNWVGWVSVNYLQVISGGEAESSESAEEAQKDRFCRVASYTFMGLIEDIAAASSAYGLGKLICKAAGRSNCYSSTSVGQGICKAAGRSDCYSSTSVGQGICKAAGRSNCYSSTSVGQGICKAAGRSNCYSSTSVGQGICKAAGRSDCYSSTSVGQGICKAAGRSNCYSSTSMGQGICKAAGGADCTSVHSLGDGICKGAGVGCNTPTLEEALCRAAGAGDCAGVSFSKMLAVSIKVCGPEILYDYKSQE